MNILTPTLTPAAAICSHPTHQLIPTRVAINRGAINRG